MKTNKLLILLFCCLLLIFCACSDGKNAADNALAQSDLRLTGDVQNELYLSGYGEYETAQIEKDGQKLTVIPMTALLEAAVVNGKGDISVFFAAPDGVMAEIPYEQMNICYLNFSADKGWECVAPNHPPQTNIKYIDKIVVCAGEPIENNRCLRILNGDKLIAELTYGRLFNAETKGITVLEGQPVKNEASAKAYTRRNLIPLDQYIPYSALNQAAYAYFGDGSQKQIVLDGYLEWRGNSLDYIEANGRNRLKDLIGIWINAPAASTMDIAPLAEQKLAEGQRVLIIELDGLGYENSLKIKGAPFAANPSFNLQKARTGLPAISNVSLATIATGLTPYDTGITEKGLRDFKEGVSDLFTRMSAIGKSVKIIEGHTVLVNFGIDQQLNPDSDDNGSTDDEVFASAQAALEQGTDLTFVHFHGIDDAEHSFGPYSSEAQKVIEANIEYVDQLLEGFAGFVIICADHGQHNSNDEAKPGTHGILCPEDMLVPLITFSK